MHIGIDARFWNETGVGRYTRNLISQLQHLDTKNTYTLYTISKNVPSLKKELTNPNFYIKTADIKWHTIKEQVEFPKILQKDRLDLVHFPYFSVPIFYNRPYVITIHDLILHHFPTGEASTLPLPIYRIKHAAYMTIIQKAAQNAKKVIAVSKATKEEIIDHLKIPAEKVDVIYEGVDKSLTVDKIHSKKSNDILHVGNLYPHKNMDRLLAAMQILVEKKIDMRLLIVGRKDYFYKKFSDKVKANGLDDLIIFKGEVSDKELSELYQSVAATIVPSLMEGFGLPALEAMANRCLILSSDIPSLKEVCKDAAIYFEPLDAKDIAQKITDTLEMSESDKKKKTEVGYNRAQQFTWEKMGNETRKVYESCVGIRQSK
jgi:glycosyltransferase involved in cell wall biosynthesis